MAAINAEKQQNPAIVASPSQQQASGGAVQDECKGNDLESGTSAPSKPVRRKFSRTVPYETEINGQEAFDTVNQHVGSDSVSVIVLFLSPPGALGWLANRGADHY